MGFIDKFKNIFSKRIDTSNTSQDKVLSLVLHKSIKYGKMLEVQPGQVAVFVAKGKVADVFNEGNYRLELGYLPILSRILKLAKPNKKGKVPNKFYAELYVINLKEFKDLTFTSYDVVNVKDKKYKNVNVKLQGEFNFEIFSPIEFLEALMTQFGLLKDSIAKTEISNWVAELAVKKVQKNKPSIEQLYTRDTVCFEGLAEYVNKEIFDCGVKVTSIEVTNTIFPKKIFQSVQLDYTELNPTNPTQDVNLEDENQLDKNQLEQYLLQDNNNNQNINPNNLQGYNNSYNTQSISYQNQTVQNNQYYQNQNNIPQVQNDYQTVQNYNQTQQQDYFQNTNDNYYNQNVNNTLEQYNQTQYLNNNNYEQYNQNTYEQITNSNGYGQAENQPTTYQNEQNNYAIEQHSYNQLSTQNSNIAEQQNQVQSEYNLNETQNDDLLNNNSTEIQQDQTINIEPQQDNRINIDPEIIKTIGYKMCLNCGAYNSTTSEHCFNCKCKI